MVLGVYLGWTTLAAEVTVQPDIALWLSILPSLAGFFIQGSVTLMVVGICVALSGRAVRWYLEHDARLLRNVALIIIIAWSRQILLATSDLLISPGIGYESVIFSIFVGVLLAIASLLVIFVVHRSARGFFQETEEQAEEFGDS
jgi:hypothetical protein